MMLSSCWRSRPKDLEKRSALRFRLLSRYSGGEVEVDVEELASLVYEVACPRHGWRGLQDTLLAD